MEFVFLTFFEVEGAAIRWDGVAVKSPELVAAALAAGFTEQEAHGSPLGVLTEDFPPGPRPMFRRGARALIGTNGSTLVEVCNGPVGPAGPAAAADGRLGSDS